MKKLVDVLALERELENRLGCFECRYCFLQSDKGESKINTLVERLQALHVIKKHFDLIQWLMGNTDITRATLLDQDRV